MNQCRQAKARDGVSGADWLPPIGQGPYVRRTATTPSKFVMTMTRKGDDQTKSNSDRRLACEFRGHLPPCVPSHRTGSRRGAMPFEDEISLDDGRA